ncbi:hypothetical protein SAMN04488056_106118 [Cohaesibacter marisflavi]|uniref:Phage tail assembly chaperone protein n=1 Tax=Cohaesibacter marisflavi TaxID=655353 RepID=A0A1I5HA40_9HYPH|nr:hypothetical protein [Cohaesibacter marisflavi]SFO45135.1 hypothetical protein SAMN04488056_106118 [Cohaesibacter marisflavi]
MRYALVIEDIVDSISFEQVAPDWVPVSDGVFAGFLQNPDGTFSAPVKESPAPTQDDYEEAIQNLLEETARSRRYKQGATAFATYVTSQDPEWAAEAQAFVKWRDTVWRYAYQQLDAVLAGEREQPTLEELLAELPVPNWPAQS